MRRKKKKVDGVLFGGVWGFSRTYPKLVDALLIYEEFDFSGLVKSRVHSLCQHGHVVECSNPRCQEGGYDLRPDIELMMSLDPMRSKAIHRQCDGWERQPRSQRDFGDVCTGSIEGTLELKLRGDGRWRLTKAN